LSNVELFFVLNVTTVYHVQHVQILQSISAKDRITCSRGRSNVPEQRARWTQNWSGL